MLVVARRWQVAGLVHGAAWGKAGLGQNWGFTYEEVLGKLHCLQSQVQSAPFKVLVPRAVLASSEPQRGEMLLSQPE